MEPKALISRQLLHLSYPNLLSVSPSRLCSPTALLVCATAPLPFSLALQSRPCTSCAQRASDIVPLLSEPGCCDNARTHACQLQQLMQWRYASGSAALPRQRSCSTEPDEPLPDRDRSHRGLIISLNLRSLYNISSNDIVNLKLTSESGS